MYSRTQLVLFAVSGLSALVGPYYATEEESKSVQPASYSQQPVFFTAVQGQQPVEVPALNKGSGAGFNKYAEDPLEGRVEDLERRVSEAERKLSTVAATPAQSAVTTSQAVPNVNSQTVTTAANGVPVMQSDGVSAAGVVAVKTGSTGEQVVASLRALGYSAYTPSTSYGAYGVSYGSTGASAPISYGSGGAEAYGAYGVSYGSAGSSAYGSPVYAGPVMPAYQSAVSYSTSAAPRVRAGLFGLRGARAANYGAYSASGTCRIVNGQVVCN